MKREQAVETDGTWAGFVTMEGGVESGWHHHGEYESVIYVIGGSVEFDSGLGGRDTVAAGPGDFVFVEPRAVHRERNIAGEPTHAIVVRSGSGPAVINVDGPEPG
jgi:uncharacterized RmlC-like cupin family protein